MGYFQGFPGDPVRPIDRLVRYEFFDASVVAPVGATYIAQRGTLSTARSVKLPRANTAVAGSRLIVVDESGTVTAANFIQIQMAANSGDTFFASGMTTLNLTKAGGWVELATDGISKWAIVSEQGSTPVDIWGPGLLASTVADLSLAVGTRTLTAANQFFAKIPVLRPFTTASISYEITTAGATLTNCFVSLYNSSGTLLVQSADQSAVWTSTGSKTTTLVGTPTWTGPTTFVWACFYVGAAVTAVVIRAGNETDATFLNIGTSTSTRRFATLGLASTATMPTVTPSSMVSSAAGPIVAVLI